MTRRLRPPPPSLVRQAAAAAADGWASAAKEEREEWYRHDMQWCRRVLAVPGWWGPISRMQESWDGLPWEAPAQPEPGRPVCPWCDPMERYCRWALWEGAAAGARRALAENRKVRAAACPRCGMPALAPDGWVVRWAAERLRTGVRDGDWLAWWGRDYWRGDGSPPAWWPEEG